jgi:hypothetical protein
MILVALFIAVSMFIWPPQSRKEKMDIYEEIEELVEAQIELEERNGK